MILTPLTTYWPSTCQYPALKMLRCISDLKNKIGALCEIENRRPNK